MGHRRRTQQLLHKKLLAIREYLALGQVDMAESLQSEILSHARLTYNIKPGRVSEYELARREPNLIVLVAYARLGKVHLELVVDDRFTVDEVREKLGKHKL